MAKASSFLQEPWTSFQKGEWSIFNSDFPVDVVGFKVYREGATSTVEIKRVFSLSREGKVSGSKEEVKLWFPIPNGRTLYFRLKEDHWKFLIDNGIRQYQHLNLSLHGCLRGRREWGRESVKIGLQVSDKHWATNFRLSFVPKGYGLELYNKTYFSHQNWRCQLINGFNFNNQIWSHSTLQVTNKSDESQWDVRADAGNKHSEVHPRNYLSNIVADYVYSWNKNTRVGIQLNFDFTGKKYLTGTTGIWEYSGQNSRVKVKADISRNICLSVTNCIKDFGKYIFGVSVGDLGQSNRFGCGVELSMNM